MAIVTFEMSNNGYTKIENFSQIDVIMTFNQTVPDQYRQPASRRRSGSLTRKI